MLRAKLSFSSGIATQSTQLKPDPPLRVPTLKASFAPNSPKISLLNAQVPVLSSPSKMDPFSPGTLTISYSV